jgi:uncharacterized protein YcnI
MPYAFNRLPVVAAFVSGSLMAPAMAHITLPPESALAGSNYEAAFRVGHPCQGAELTTGVEVALPKGFVLTTAQPRPGWSLQARPDKVIWTVTDASQAIASGIKITFVLRGKLPEQTGTLWFKVRQTCEHGVADWDQIPGQDGVGDKPERPAARLELIAP